jgi:hypothetical protein
MPDARPRYQLTLVGLVLALFAFAWLIRNHLGELSDRSWAAAAMLGILVVSAINYWLRLRRFAPLRPWILRHLIGNLILAIGVCAAWFFDLAIYYYILIAAGIFGMWIWGNRKLREVGQSHNGESDGRRVT